MAGDDEVEAMNAQVLHLHQSGRSAEGVPVGHRAVALAETRFGPEHRDVGVSVINFAELYRALGHYADAEPLYKRGLSIFEKALGPEHHDVGTCLINLAELYRAQGHYADAEPLYKRGIIVYENALDADHRDVGVSLNNLAELYRAMGRYSDAEPLYRRGIAIVEKALGPNHPHLGTSLNNLAELYRARDRYSDAEPLYKHSISIFEKALGPDHPYFGTSLINLAVLYGSQGNHADAEPLYKRGLSILENALGPDHPHVGTSLNNLAELYLAAGRRSEATELANRARKISGWRTAHIPVLFATNRGRQDSKLGLSFGNDQKINSSDVSLGVATILAPETEVLNRAVRAADALGQLHKASGRQTSDLSLSIIETEIAKSSSDLFAAARERLRRASRFPAQALVYVHGYNNTFDEAVRRTAKIAFDLDFDGIAMAFAWPSKRGLLGYGGDRERARIASPFLLDFLETIGRELLAVTVHLIGHSTGGEVLLHTLERLADRSSDGQRVKLGQLVLAHADVNRLRFRQALPTLKKLGLGITSYTSSEDWAMWLSRLARFEKARLGGRPILADGVVSIDITGLGRGALAINHNVFVTNSLVFGDIHQLMANGIHPPDRRTPSFKPVMSDAGTYWAYRPN